MNDLATLHRLLENLVRYGRIAAVQHQPPRVRVRTGDLTTTWLPWLTTRAGKDQTWDPPTEGEQVVVIAPSGQLANAFVLTGLYQDAIPANDDRPDLHRRSYRDGAVIEYDSHAHHLGVTLPASATLSLVSDGGLHIVGTLTHQGDYIQQGNQQVSGTVTVGEDVIAAGVSLVNHPHGDVTPGLGKTGKPEATS